jgi:hypothetical protein
MQLWMCHGHWPNFYSNYEEYRKNSTIIYGGARWHRRRAGRLGNGGPEGPVRVRAGGRANLGRGKTDTLDYLMYHTVHQSAAPEPHVTKNGP